MDTIHLYTNIHTHTHTKTHTQTQSHTLSHTHTHVRPGILARIRDNLTKTPYVHTMRHHTYGGDTYTHSRLGILAKTPGASDAMFL